MIKILVSISVLLAALSFKGVEKDLDNTQEKLNQQIAAIVDDPCSCTGFPPSHLNFGCWAGAVITCEDIDVPCKERKFAEANQTIQEMNTIYQAVEDGLFATYNEAIAKCCLKPAHECTTCTNEAKAKLDADKALLLAAYNAQCTTINNQLAQDLNECCP